MTERANPSRDVVLFAGGGTGGHIYPALAIAQRLEAMWRGDAGGAGGGAGREQPRCVFVVSDRAVDARVMEPTGREFVAIPARPLSLRPKGLVQFLWRWGQCVRRCRGLIRDARIGGASVRVVTTGGFVAAPMVQAAIVERAPVTLVNLDAVPGKANAWIEWRLRGRREFAGAFTALPVAGGKAGGMAGRLTLVPPIVREGASAGMDATGCRAALGLDVRRPVLMITGGSLGARSVTDFVLGLCAEHASAMREWQVLHQVGNAEGEAERVRGRYAAMGIDAVVAAFVERMGLWWGSADLAISRAGAGAVAEAWANTTPTVFMPYPYHKDQHQRVNATRLVEVGGAVVVDDLIDAGKTLSASGAVVRGLIDDAARRAAMRRALEGLGPADGAERIARTLMA
jgi:UDP-N-acetylglucosamine--N-acetylmuramyl-(pentapeptide) pyrophosphoryl-undecaprenol N-acetylglucosamine transferase